MLTDARRKLVQLRHSWAAVEGSPDTLFNAAIHPATLPDTTFWEDREKLGAAGAGAQRWHRGWRAADTLKRPSASLFLDFALALLRAADDALLCRLLTVQCAALRPALTIVPSQNKRCGFATQ